MGEEHQSLTGIITDMAGDVGEIKGTLKSFVDSQNRVNETVSARLSVLENFKLKIAALCLTSAGAGGGVVHGLLKWLG